MISEALSPVTVEDSSAEDVTSSSLVDGSLDNVSRLAGLETESGKPSALDVSD